MSTLTTYEGLVTEKLGTSATSYFTTASRISAINEAIVDITNSYDVPDMFKVATLALTSGVGAIPTDFFRMVKMWHATDASPEYTFVQPDLFDQTSSDTQNYWWTMDYSTSASAIKIMVNPTTVTSVRIRYVKEPTTLSAGSDESGLPSIWDDAIAYKAAAVLANNANQFNKMQSMEIQAKSSMSRAYGASKNVGGVKGYARLRSTYEKYSILGDTHPN